MTFVLGFTLFHNFAQSVPQALHKIHTVPLLPKNIMTLYSIRVKFTTLVDERV
jgi:hypothetical protein